MLTQCPKCETIYRLGAADLGSAQGFVECGECGERFNALERLADEPKFSAGQSPLASGDGAAAPPLPDAKAGPASGPVFVLLDTDEATATIEPAAAQTLSESEHAILFTDPGAEFGEEPAEDIESVDLDEVPSILQAEVAALNRPRRERLRWLWMWLAILFTAGLTLQLAWVFRDRMLAALPDTRPLYVAACEQLGCRIEPPAATRAIELLSRDVRDHPQYLNTLLVNATLVSRSKTATAFPIIELGLYGHTGEVIGIRRFEPREYLDKSIDLAAGMPPNRPVTIVLEIAGVGRRAVSFEFTFL